MSKKGNGKGPGDSWRRRILAENNTNKRFRGRLRFKGSNNPRQKKSTNKGPGRGGWAAQVKAQKGQAVKSWSSSIEPGANRTNNSPKPKRSLSQMRARIQSSRTRAQIKGKRIMSQPGVKRPIVTPGFSSLQKSSLFKSNPVAKKQITQKKSNLQPKPATQKDTSKISKGIQRLRQSANKQTLAASQKSVSKPPSEGTFLLKQKAAQAKSLSQGKPRVKVPIRRGR